MLSLKRLVFPATVPALMVCLILMAGCRALVPPADELNPEPIDEGTADTQQQVEPPTELADPSWILRVPELGKTLDPEKPRWRHIGLEELLTQPSESRPDLRIWLDHKNPIVAANAAIGLARLGEANVSEPLAAAIRKPKLRMPQRRAAAEALGSQDRPHNELESLLEQYGDFQGPGESNYRSELHIDLLRSLFAHDARHSLVAIEKSLESPAKEVRLEALQLWPRCESEEVPQQIVEMVSDVDPQVRIEAIGLLASRKHEQTATLARKAITDQRMEVRLAAVAALGTVGGDSVRAILVKLKSNPLENIRAAAVTALAESGAMREVLASSEDESRHVRQAVARSLRRNVEFHAVRAAHKLIHDRSIQVSATVVDSVVEWPLDRSGPVWIAALKANSLTLRQLAVEKMTPHWPVVKDFPADSNPQRRAEALEEIYRQWRIEFPGIPLEFAKSEDAKNPEPETTLVADPKSLERVERLLKQLADTSASEEERQATEQSLTELGLELPRLLTHVVRKRKTPLPERLYDNVFPKLDPSFELLVRLKSIDVAERRQAASALSMSTEQKRLNLLALERLVQIITPEPDDLVWRSVQEALMDDSREPAARLNMAALSHSSGEVRRRACEHLQKHPDPSQEAALLAALGDTSPAVRLAAVRAIAQLDKISNPLPLVRLLASREKTLVLATATALVKLGYENGGDALERLSHDQDAGVRRQAVEAMGSTGEPRFVSTLVRMLGGQLNVKRAALASLKAVVGRDIGQQDDPEPPAMAEQIRRWRQWHYQNQARGNNSIPKAKPPTTRRDKKSPAIN